MPDRKLQLIKIVSERVGWDLDEHDALTQGLTSSVFPGHVAGQKVVFKFYNDEVERQMELWALAKLSGMNKIPQVIANVDSGPMVLSRLQGLPFACVFPRIDETRDPVAVAIAQEAAGFLAEINGRPCAPFEEIPGDPSEPGSLARQRSSYGRFMSAVLKRCREYMLGNTSWNLPYFVKSLDRWAQCLPGILAEKRCLFYDDYNPNNILVKDGQFSGLVDFGPTREGSVSAQLGSLLFDSTRRQIVADRVEATRGRDDFPEQPWATLFQAYEDHSRGVEIEVFKNTLILFHFQIWQRLVCWGGGWEKKFLPPSALADALKKIDLDFENALRRRVRAGRWA